MNNTTPTPNSTPGATASARFGMVHRMQGWWRGRRQARVLQDLRQRCPPAAVAVDQIAPQVRAAWAREVPQEFPGLRVDDASWLRCALGLAQFFEACRLQQASGACALPSRGADSVWHVWLEVDPDGLAAWQQRYFGREVPHIEAEALGAPLDDCLARTWAGACRSEGLSPVGRRLPMLFALDDLLGLPAGWAYRFEQGSLVHRDIDGFGRAVGSPVVHAAVTGGGLAALGLVSAAEVEAQRRRQQGDGGSSCGTSWAVPDSGCDAGSSSSSCDGGSSSGSSCGGSSCGGGS